MGMRQAPSYMMESQILPQQAGTIRIAESIIQLIPTFHGIWKHSSKEMVVIDTKTNYLFGLKCLDRSSLQHAIN